MDTVTRLRWTWDGVLGFALIAVAAVLVVAGVFVTGRLLADKIGPFIQEPPTTANLLDGLYALKGETLGGFLPGISFEKGVEHSKSNQCIIPVRFTGGKLVAHDAAESFVCPPTWKPVGR